MAFNYQAFYNTSPYGYSSAQSGDMANTYQYNAVMPGTAASSSAPVTAFQTPSGASHYAAAGSNTHLTQIGGSNAGDSLSAYSQQHVYSQAFPNALTLGSAGFDGGNGFGDVQRLHQYGSSATSNTIQTANVGTPYQAALRNAIESTMVGTGGSAIPTTRRNEQSNVARFNAGSYTGGSSYGGGGSSGTGAFSGNKTGAGQNMFPRSSVPEKWRVKRMEQKAARGGAPAQQHYCEICRVACAGSQTYKEHLEGRQHKKKEAAAAELDRLEKAKQAKLLPAASANIAVPITTITSSGPQAQPAKPVPVLTSAAAPSPAAAQANKTEFRCTLCDVACTGAEAYAAHLRGQKHLRTMRLHQKMGRPIPQQAVPAAAPATASNVTATANAAAPVPVVNQGGWVAGSVLKMQDGKLQELKPAVPAPVPAAPAAAASASASTAAAAVAPAKVAETAASPGVPIVGSEYIVQRTNEKGQLTGFECKLCECSFTDLNGRDMHLRGKRHRLAYRQKVDPHFRVPDANNKSRRDETRFAAKKTRDDRVERTRETHWFEQAHMSNAFWSGPPGYLPPFGAPSFGPGGPMGGYPPWLGYSLTRDDEYVQKRLKEIEPSTDEARVLQHIVLTCERALKQVSDVVQSHRDEANRVTFDVVQPVAAAGEQPADADVEMDAAGKKDDAASSAKGLPKPTADSNPNRVLKGVVRVGALANCLLRRGEMAVTLVVLSAEKPTRRLLQLVYDELPRKLQQMLDDDNDAECYAVQLNVDRGEIVVSKNGDLKCECTVRLTSSLVREEALATTTTTTTTTATSATTTTTSATTAASVLAPGDAYLDRERCLEALALLRRAKWFQAKCLPHAPTVACLRLIRDLCARVSTWQPLSEWLTALLVQRCAESAPIPPCAAQPGLLLRRFFELIAGGFLVLAVRESSRYTLNDPCEKEPINVVRSELTLQTAEDITGSAQHALRLIAYHQMFKVINTERISDERASDSTDQTTDKSADEQTGESQMDTESANQATNNDVKTAVSAASAASAAAPKPAVTAK